MGIAVYLRTSSDKGQRTDSQRTEIEKYLMQHRLTDVQWYEDKDASGVTIQRPSFQRLEEAIFRGEVDTVIVFRLDRLSRSFAEGVAVITKWCNQGIRLIAVTQQIDLNGTVGQLVAGVLFAVAEMEHEAIRERQQAGIEVAKTKGVYRGRKKGTYKASAQRAKALRAKGLTLQEIAAALGVSRSTIVNYLYAESDVSA